MELTNSNRFSKRHFPRLALVSIMALTSACDRSESNKPPEPPPAPATAKPQPATKLSPAKYPLHATYYAATRIKDKGKRSSEISKTVTELRKLDARQIAELFSSLDLASNQDDYDFGMLCIGVMAGKDALATLALIETLTRLELPEPGTGTIVNLAMDLLGQNKDACVAWLGKHPFRRNDPLVALVFNLTYRLAEIDPHAAANLLEGKPNGNSQLASMVLAKIAVTDVTLAAELGRERLGEDTFGEIAGALLSAAVRTDYFGCMKLYESLGSTAQIQAAGSLVQAMWRKDPSQTLRFLESQPSGVVASALKYFTSDDPSATTGLNFNPSIRALVAHDPERATSVLSKVPFTEASRALYLMFGDGLISLSPEAAATWLATVPDGPAKEDLTRSMFQTLGTKQPQSAWELAASQPEEARQQAFRGVAAALATTDLGKAMALAGTIPESLQPDVFREIGRANTLNNPANAVELLEDPAFGTKVGAPFRSEMLQHTVGKWSETDLPAARSWLESLPQDDLASATRGLISTWMKTDPDAAVAWLAAQSQGPARAAGTAEAIKQVERTDPAKAREWNRILGP
jgi:hypothetical protein